MQRRKILDYVSQSVFLKGIATPVVLVDLLRISKTKYNNNQERK